jgi:hypothetical protein
MPGAAAFATQPLGALGRRAVAGDDSEIIDLSCGHCPLCASGSSWWCENPGDVSEGERLGVGRRAPTEKLDRLIDAALVASAAVQADLRGATVTVVGPGRRPLLEMVRGMGAARILQAPDTLDVELLATLSQLEATGRPGFVLTLGDIRSAVLSVRRGGAVCAGRNGGELPSLKELVQREVRVLGPADVFALLEALGPKTWAAAVAAA